MNEGAIPPAAVSIELIYPAASPSIFWRRKTLFIFCLAFKPTNQNIKPAIAAMHGPHSLVRFGD